MTVLETRRAERIWLWFGLLVGSQITDLATTAASLHLGGLEVNPVVAGILSSGGLARLVLLKLLTGLAVVALIGLVSELGQRLPGRLAVRAAAALVRVLQLTVAVQIFASIANVVVMSQALRG